MNETDILLNKDTLRMNETDILLNKDTYYA